MPKIYFTSGKTLEITEYEFEKMAPKLQMGGIRLYRTAKGNLIPLNSTTMELIEKETTEDVFVGEQVEVQEEVKKEEVLKPDLTEHDEMKGAEPITKPAEKKPETEQERQDRMMAELVEKSNCLHPRELLEMRFQATKAGNRYFPVCTFCGYRHRYISVKKIKSGAITDWTMDDLVTAKKYQES